MKIYNISIEELLVLGVAFLGFLSTYVFMHKYFAHRDNKKRMDRLQNITQRGLAEKKTSSPQTVIQKSVKNFSLDKKSSLSDAFKVPDSQAKIIFEQAGLNPINAASIMNLAKLGTILTSLMIGFVLITFVPPINQMRPLLLVCVMLLALLLGFKGVGFYLQFITKLRYGAIRRNLSSALDLLVICTNAGLSIDKSFEQVAQEIGDSNRELGKELALTAIELGILPDRRIALQNLAKRVNIPLVRALSTTLVQAEEQGSSVSETLKVLSHEFSGKILMEAEAKAARLPATLSIPVVVLILPSLMIVLLAPAILSLNDTYHLF